MKKINIAELLKDCPSGMELDCTMYDNAVFDGVSDDTSYPIDVRSDTMKLNLTKAGGYSNSPDTKRIYTKKQLLDMGFAFTTNGDIVTPDQLNKDLKKYLKYQKQKFIEKGKEWLFKHVDDKYLFMKFRHINDAIENFEKWMEE